MRLRSITGYNTPMRSQDRFVGLAELNCKYVVLGAQPFFRSCLVQNTRYNTGFVNSFTVPAAASAVSAFILICGVQAALHVLPEKILKALHARAKFSLARAHRMRTYEPRQGRKAATVVCSAYAVVTLACGISDVRV